MNSDDDREFGEWLNNRATALANPLGVAATFYAQRVLDLVAEAVSTGDLGNTLQGDLELARAAFLDECVRLFNAVDEGTRSEQDSVESLLNPARVYSRSEVMARKSCVPARPGVYAWYFREVPPEVPVTNCRTFEDKTLLYIGISPTQRNDALQAGRQNLRRRLKQHFGGNADSSTLRLTLGCLLEQKLGIKLQRVGRSFTFGDGELRLSEWMEENAFVCWLEAEKPWVIESRLFSELAVPLNLRGNDHHDFHATLSAKRKAAKHGARLSGS